MHKYLIFCVFLCHIFAGDFEDGMQALKQKKYEHALQLLKQSCDKSNAEACYQVGRIYFKGLGVKEDDLETNSYYLKGCKLGLEKACKASDDLDPGC